MNDVDNPVNMIGYLSPRTIRRLADIYGQDFTDQYRNINDGNILKGKGQYVKSGKKLDHYVFPADATHFFPTNVGPANDQGHADYYAGWMGLPQDADGNFKKDSDGNYLTEDGELAKPNMADNISFFYRTR